LVPYVRDPGTVVTSYATTPRGVDLSEPADVIIAHNAIFDAMVHAKNMRPHPLQWRCTMSMSRLLAASDPDYSPPGHSLRELAHYLGLGEKGDTVAATAAGGEALAAYNQHDADLTAALYDALMARLRHVLSSVRLEVELEAIHYTVMMAADPVLLLDSEPLVRFIEDEERRRDQVEAMYRSPTQFAAFLEAHGVTLPQTEKGAPSVSDSVLDDVVAARPDLTDHIAKRRMVASAGELTKAKKFLEIATMFPDQWGEHTLPVILKYAGAHTLRWSGDAGLNIQAMARGGAVRNAIVAPKGYVIIAADMKQIEARCLLAHAGQEDMLDDMVSGRDAYKIMAGAIYGKPADTVTAAERHIGKMAVLGCGYGMGVNGAVRQITKDRLLAQRVVHTYRAKAHMVVNLWRELDKAIARAAGGDLYLKVPFSDRVMVWRSVQSDPDPYSDIDQFTYLPEDGAVRKSIYGGKVTENLIQAAARDILLAACIAANRVLDILPAALVHDEIVYVVPEDYAEEVVKAFSAPRILVPLDFVEWSVNISNRYGECK
jgi:hypothetical protein